MILDKEEHKKMLLGMIKHSQFMGESIDQLYELKQSIENATTKKE